MAIKSLQASWLKYSTKKNIIFSLLFVLTSYLTFSQQILTKQWDRRFGGSSGDVLDILLETKGGGYILGGSSASEASGDKSESNWDISLLTRDFWILEIDSDSNKLWDKRFGGTSTEGLYSLQQTTDAGYILAGRSYSGMNGNKTQPSWGSGDYWVVKVDSIGNKQWDKRFGGILDDELYAVQQTSNGGYILGGYSFSGIGGDKTQDNRDLTNSTSDFWVVKIDSSGNKQWDKRFGGNDMDGINSLLQTCDGGYILGGTSSSGISGDKTQTNWDTITFSYDMWIVKIDSSGYKLWDKRFGGKSSDHLFNVLQLSDGGYLMAGASASGIEGDKTSNGTGYWIVKIDSAGNKLWDKVYQPATADPARISSFFITKDGGFLIGNFSGLNAGGDKSEDNLGPTQTWVVKTDSLGNKQWDKTIFTTGFDDSGYAIETKEGCYLIGNYTFAGIGGYKTQSNWAGSTDCWVVKFCFEAVGINDLNDNPNVLVYPNPFTTDIAITLQKENLKEATFTISNMLGQVLFIKEENNLASSYTKMLDLSYLPNGVYLVEVIADGERVVKKVVKE